MAQRYTSAGTSVNSRVLPAVYRKASFSAAFILDYGCGKYTEHIAQFLHEQGRELFPFDPYNQPEEVNLQTRERVKVARQRHIPIDIVCSNVLNVIDDDGVIRSIIDQIEATVQATGGTAYITVYEGNRSGTGRQTGRDQYQRNQPLRDYLQYISAECRVKNGMIIIG